MMRESNNSQETINNDNTYLIINDEIADIDIIFKNFIDDLQLLLNDLLVQSDEYEKT